MSFVVKMSNGHGYVEWYMSLAVRMQADRREDARVFTTREAAEQAVTMCKNHGSAFSEAYYDSGRGCYFIEATIEPA